jgi:hypothetical protein
MGIAGLAKNGLPRPWIKKELLQGDGIVKNRRYGWFTGHPK